MGQIKKDKNGNEDFFNLCSYIEKEILEYEPNQKLQKMAALKLRGLSSGQNIANNKSDQYGEYPYDVILLAFKMYRASIVNALNKKNFNSESQKVGYACAIVRDKLNSVYSRYISAMNAKNKIENLNTEIVENKGAKYKPVEKDNKSKEKFRELW